MFTDRPSAVGVYHVYLPGPQGPTVLARKTVSLRWGSGPGSHGLYGVVRRRCAPKVQRTRIGREQGLGKLNGFFVAFLRRNGRLEQVPLLEESGDFTSAVRQFAE